MATKKKLLQAAAGSAGGGALNVEDVFSTYVYTGGNGSGTNQAVDVVNGLDLAGEGGLTWFKIRTTTTDHALFDSENNSFGSYLRSNTTAASNTLSNHITPNSDGFTVGSTGYNITNNPNNNYVSWAWRKAPKFFDIQTWTGDGTVRQISHNLGSTPGMIIVKRTDTSGYNWYVYHRSTGASGALALDVTDAFFTYLALWNNTAPTSTHFTVGNNGNVNDSGGTYVAYLFAHNDGDGEFGPDGDADIIKCGSYTGTGAVGLDVDLGWEPQWLLVKRTDSADNWVIADNMRGIYGQNSPEVNHPLLQANESIAEFVSSYFKLNADGFQLQSTAGRVNESGGNYIYIAIRRGPMAVPEDATEVFAIDQGDGSSTDPQWVSNFPVDMGIWKRTSGSNTGVGTRLLQGRGLFANLMQAENAQSLWQFDHQDGWYDAALDTSYYSWMWKRAPNYFDVVAYTGNGVAGRTVSHNLGVAPEMMWIKWRDGTQHWYVYSAPVGNEKTLFLSSDASASSASIGYWYNTSPTSTDFTLGLGPNQSGRNYIAYLFASLDGVSKVGSYTGDGTTDGSKVIDCGFSSGARFVLLKKSTGSGEWYLFDTDRGIVSGNESRLELNTTSAESTGDDFIDPASSGFAVNGHVNQSGETYIFYAIA